MAMSHVKPFSVVEPQFGARYVSQRRKPTQANIRRHFDDGDKEKKKKTPSHEETSNGTQECETAVCLDYTLETVKKQV